MILDDENAILDVVVNDEGQYSIWPTGKALPSGWRATGKSGLKAECLAYIEEAWHDIRPRSLLVDPPAVGTTTGFVS
jgi:MbtH protein